ncbi:MAG: hypothetical protein LH472_15320 [Pyrinomonadaceae bacterium]|nr:hypothetical protein [Pyrinomonadaceae bacterium]
MSKSPTRKDFLSGNYLRFQKFGVKIGIQAAKPAYLREVYVGLEKIFPNGFEPAAASEIEYQFSIKSNGSKKDENLEFYLNDEKLFENGSREIFFDLVESRIRITVAEFAVGKVFLHAGVVGWQGKAIIIPATSFSGKTTLVAELVKKGAAYYSDEYAVLDADGNVEPFPKWLSLRGIIDDWTQLDCPVEAIGGIAATGTIPVGLVLIARYDKAKKSPRKWQPRKLSQGAGIMEILPHTLPIRNKPKFVLEVLKKLTNRAIIVKTVRGDAVEFAETLLSYVESQTK